MPQFLVLIAQYGALRGGEGKPQKWHKHHDTTRFCDDAGGRSSAFFERKIRRWIFLSKKAEPRPPASSQNRVVSWCLCHFCDFPFPPRRAPYCAVKTKNWRIMYRYHSGMMRYLNQIVKIFNNVLFSKTHHAMAILINYASNFGPHSTVRRSPRGERKITKMT